MEYIDYVNSVLAAAYYDGPEDEPEFCGGCAEFDYCPGGCGWGMCSYFGEFKNEDQDACGQYRERTEEG